MNKIGFGFHVKGRFTDVATSKTA